MKKEARLIVLCSLIGLMCFIVFISCMNYFFFSMYHLPEGELMDTVYSPDESYIINSYLTDGGATVASSVRCEVVTVSTGQRRNIYWQYRCKTSEIVWIDETTVSINGKELNVITDSYDWRKE